MARKIGMGRSQQQAHSNSWDDYLDPDEKLLWQGAPATGLKLTGKGIFLSLFGLFFLGFSVVWVTMASMMQTGMAFDYIFPLFGLPFVLVGLWLVVGHWFFDAYKRKRARYALTTKRAIIARSMINRRMESYEITKNSPLSLVEGDLDTVNFAQKTTRSNNGPTVVDIGFRYITGGREVYNLMQDVQKNSA